MDLLILNITSPPPPPHKTLRFSQNLKGNNRKLGARLTELGSAVFFQLCDKLKSGNASVSRLNIKKCLM